MRATSASGPSLPITWPSWPSRRDGAGMTSGLSRTPRLPWTPLPPRSYLFYVILSPVGSYYPQGMTPLRILVTDTYVRAVQGGVGAAKTAGNYAASLLAAEEAHHAGYEQVLWLDGVHRRFIDAV